MRWLALWLALLAAGCGKATAPDEGRTMKRPIGAVQEKYSEQLMSVPGVVGTAVGLCNQKPCIKVFVVKKTPELSQRIPAQLEGYPVSIEETGEIKAMPQNR